MTVLKSLTEEFTSFHKLINFHEQKRLVKEFVYIYELQCRRGTINPKDRIESLKHTKGYDQDVIRVLLLMQLLHKYYGEKITIKQLILIWGDAFDETWNKNLNLWDDELWKIVCKQKKPLEYKRYLENHSIKMLEDNSFLKYKGTTLKYNGTETEKKDAIEKYISFLTAILAKVEECTHIQTVNDKIWIPREEKRSLNIFEKGFINFVNSLKLPDKKKRGETNLDMIRRKAKKKSERDIKMPFIYTGVRFINNKGELYYQNGYLDILKSNYASIFYEGLGFK